MADRQQLPACVIQPTLTLHTVQQVEALAREDERDAGLRAAEYRTEVERDAETIRQILERQHIRDLGQYCTAWLMVG